MAKYVIFWKDEYRGTGEWMGWNSYSEAIEAHSPKEAINSYVAEDPNEHIGLTVMAGEIGILSMPEELKGDQYVRVIHGPFLIKKSCDYTIERV